MVVRSSRFVWLGCATLLMIPAAVGWLMYIGNGVAYGALVGLRGRERALTELGSRAEHALILGAICQGVAVAMGSWILLPPRYSATARVMVAATLAALADVFTFAALRGI